MTLQEDNHDVTLVTTHSIRYRILKEDVPDEDVVEFAGYNPFDPIQDTERGSHGCGGLSPGDVTTHSIRYRILKVWDPIHRATILREVTTHSIRYRILKAGKSIVEDIVAMPELQPIRSDTGY